MPLAFETEQPHLITWRNSFFARGDECPSTLVSGLPTTAPPLALPSHPFIPYSSSYTIYIDDINNNLGCLRPGQYQTKKLMLFFASLCIHIVGG
jgi:hypothetical protein